MSFPEKALQTRPVCAAENGACVNRRGRGWSWTLGRTPKEVLCLCDLSFLENPNIQMCLLQGKGRRGTQAPNKAKRIPLTSPGPLSILTFVAFNENRSKGGTGPLARDQQASSLSLLSPQHDSHRTLDGRDLAERFPSVPGSQSLTLSPCPSTRQKHPTLSP